MLLDVHGHGVTNSMGRWLPPACRELDSSGVEAGAYNNLVEGRTANCVHNLRLFVYATGNNVPVGQVLRGPPNIKFLCFNQRLQLSFTVNVL